MGSWGSLFLTRQPPAQSLRPKPFASVLPASAFRCPTWEGGKLGIDRMGILHPSHAQHQKVRREKVASGLGIRIDKEEALERSRCSWSPLIPFVPWRTPFCSNPLSSSPSDLAPSLLLGGAQRAPFPLYSWLQTQESVSGGVWDHTEREVKVSGQREAEASGKRGQGKAGGCKGGWVGSQGCWGGGRRPPSSEELPGCPKACTRSGVRG